MLPHRRMAVVHWSRIARGAKDGSEPHTAELVNVHRNSALIP